jgi:hypothetical protein
MGQQVLLRDALSALATTFEGLPEQITRSSGAAGNLMGVL